MKLELDTYISGLFYTDEVRPSVKEKFRNDIRHSDYRFSMAYEFFQNMEESVREVFPHLSDEEWAELVEFFNRHELHFGMSEEEIQAYRDAEFAESNNFPDRFLKTFQELGTIISKMSDEDMLLLIQKIRDQLNQA